MAAKGGRELDGDVRGGRTEGRAIFLAERSGQNGRPSRKIQGRGGWGAEASRSRRTEKMVRAMSGPGTG